MKQLTGLIIKGIGGFYYVKTDKGIYTCRAKGVLRMDDISPTVGDNVVIDIVDNEDLTGIVHNILPRKNTLIRPKVSNIDHLLLVFASKSPKPNFELCDKIIMFAEEQHLEITLCFNKSDIHDISNIVDERFKNTGYTIIYTSAKAEIGKEALENVLRGKITVIAGPSGVGKSSIVNMISDKLNIKTSEISKKIQRGKHTTRHSEIFEIMDNSYIVDTPGFTSLDFLHLDCDKIQYYFKEMLPFINKCKFIGCSHIKESDCAVKNAVGNFISEERYQSYVKFYNEIYDKKEY